MKFVLSLLALSSIAFFNVALAQNTTTGQAIKPRPGSKFSGGYIRPSFSFLDNISSVNDMNFREENFEAKTSDFRLDFQPALGIAAGYYWKPSSRWMTSFGAFLEKERVVNSFSAKLRVKDKTRNQEFQSSSTSASNNESTTLSIWGLDFGGRYLSNKVFYPMGGQLSSLSFSGPGIKSEELKNQMGLSLYGGIGYSFLPNISIEGVVQSTFYHIKWPRSENHTLFSGMGTMARLQVEL